MRYRRLGQTDLEVSEISLGCWTLGGLNWVNGSPNGWANVDEAEVKRAIDYALEQGVNHFDNADVYGNGRAEQMLARLLGDRTKSLHRVQDRLVSGDGGPCLRSRPYPPPVRTIPD